MKKIIIAASVSTLFLTGCEMLHQTEENTVKNTYQRESATAQNQRVERTHADEQRTVRNTPTTQVQYGTGGLTGQKASQRDVIIYRTKGVVHHDGHAYHIRDGKYVLVR